MYHNVEMNYLQLCKTSQTKTKIQQTKQNNIPNVCSVISPAYVSEKKLELRSIYSIDYLYLLNESPVLETI